MTDAPRVEVLPPPGAPIFGIERFEGVLSRRIVAFILDCILIALLTVPFLVFSFFLAVLTLGFLVIPIGGVLTFFYFTLFTGGAKSATPGMRLMGIELRDLGGGRPDLLQAGARTLVFMASNTVLPVIISAVALFDLRRRTIHDMLTSTVVARR
ncbi:MAG: RDD family protein [Alphaproteobacteria bacterium]